MTVWGCWRYGGLPGLGVLLLLGCGPSWRDFAGDYPVTVEESLTSCEGGLTRDTTLPSVQEVVIEDGVQADLRIIAGDCAWDAVIDTETTFSLSEEGCMPFDEEPAIAVKVSGTGTLVNGNLSMSLTGSYETTSYGYPVTCDYGLTISPR